VFEGGHLTLAPTGVGSHGRAMEVGETTDQLRTTTAELRADQRSTMDTSDKWFTLDNRKGPIWGSRGREFKSRQPDTKVALTRGDGELATASGVTRGAISHKPVTIGGKPPRGCAGILGTRSVRDDWGLATTKNLWAPGRLGSAGVPDWPGAAR
jgi:hypothetical protein